MFDERLQDLPEPKPVNVEKEVKTAPERQDLALTREVRLEQLMQAAFSGAIARGRDLKYWENLRLKANHIQILVMKAAGYRNNHIAEIMDMDPARISVIVNHPDAQTVLATLVSFQAEELLDIKARLRAHAGEAMNVALETMRTAPDHSVRLKASFGILDRAGYGAVQRVETKHEVIVPQKAAQNIAAAMREAEEVEEVDFEVLKEVSPEYKSADLGGATGDASGEGRSLDNSNEPPVTGLPVSHPEFGLMRRTA